MMKRTNFYFPEPMLKRLRRAAKLEGIAMSEFIRNAVEAALRRAKL
jgi:Arc/MetJ-type ribon-helix-helix transcriptional regulator